VLDDPTIAVDQHNPLCGDDLHVTVRIADDRITEIAHTGDGCSISQASASMMSDAVVGQTTDEALATIEHFRRVMHREVTANEDQLGDAIALEGVAKYPVRIKCALLSWMALKHGLLTRMVDQQEGR
jgi:nitrogen fixation NifU-like protein